MLIWTVFDVLPHFPRKWFQLRYSAVCKKLKNALFKSSEHLFLRSRLASKPISKKFPMTKFTCKQFLCFASILQKIVLTSSFRNLQKIKKCPFQMLRTFVFDFKVASKPISFREFDLLSVKTVSTSSLENLHKISENVAFEPSEQSFFTFR